MPGRGAERSRSRPSRAIARFSPTTGRHVGDGPDRGEVRQGEREGRAAGFVAQQQLGDLEGHAAAGQARVRDTMESARCGFTSAIACGRIGGTR